MTPAELQGEILRIVWARGDWRPISTNELAAALNQPAPRVSVNVSQLVRWGVLRYSYSGGGVVRRRRPRA